MRSGQAKQVPPVGDRSERSSKDLQQTVVEAVAEASKLDRSKILLTTELVEVGVDSLTLTTLLMNLEDEVGQDLPIDTFVDLIDAEVPITVAMLVNSLDAVRSAPDVAWDVPDDPG